MDPPPLLFSFVALPKNRIDLRRASSSHTNLYTNIVFILSICRYKSYDYTSMVPEQYHKSLLIFVLLHCIEGCTCIIYH